LEFKVKAPEGGWQAYYGEPSNGNEEDESNVIITPE